jgi:hypothetical protein
VCDVCTKCHETDLIFGPSPVPYKPQTVQLKAGLVFWKMAHCMNKKVMACNRSVGITEVLTFVLNIFVSCIFDELHT